MKEKKSQKELFNKKPRFNSNISFPNRDPCQIRISFLYGLEMIADRYYLTEHDLIYNQKSGLYSTINLMQSGYPYVTLFTKIILGKR